jgi:hypothetical protein
LRYKFIFAYAFAYIIISILTSINFVGLLVAFITLKIKLSHVKKERLFKEFYVEFLKTIHYTSNDDREGMQFTDYDESYKNGVHNFLIDNVYNADKEIQDVIFGFLYTYNNSDELLNSSYSNLVDLIILRYVKLCSQLGYSPYNTNTDHYKPNKFPLLNLLKERVKPKL